jgi:hypothetical protein
MILRISKSFAKRKFSQSIDRKTNDYERLRTIMDDCDRLRPIIKRKKQLLLYLLDHQIVRKEAVQLLKIG